MDTRNICPACNALYDRSIFVCVRCGTGLLEIPDAQLLSGTTLDMRYDIEGVVGTGGMGTVYKARQRGMEREVAIKVLHPRFAHEPRAVKRFFREAQAASRLIHPHIVTVYDFGRAAEGHLYMVMELLEGFTLGDLVHYRAPLPAALALAILNQICEALEEAHKQRLVHRDLKPDNILLTSTEEGLWAKVLDFGIARSVREPAEGGGLERHHSTVEIAGTPAYMSPEQILGKEPDPRSDLYSLGIILFEMLTRQRPFDDESSVTLCMKQLNEEAPRINSLKCEPPVPTVSEPLERLVRSLLEKRPEARPQRASDVRMLISKCPESSFPYSVPDVTALDAVGPAAGTRALSVKTTRAEAIPYADKTFDLGPVATGLTAVLDRANGAGAAGSAPSALPLNGKATANHSHSLRANAKAGVGDPTSVLGGSVYAARRPGVGAPVEKAAVDKKPRPVGAVAQIVAEHQGALATGELARWLIAREADGWELQREERRVLVKVPGADVGEAMRLAAKELAALQDRALAQNLGLRIGLAAIEDGQLAPAVDLARRLAVATTHGQVAVVSAAAGRVGIGVRPQTTIFMPNGQSQECAVIRRDVAVGEARIGGAAEARPGVGNDDADDAGLLWGRGLQLRRLGQIGDESLRQGPTTALVQGARGMGKTSLLNAFLIGRMTVRIRVSPVAAAWPGHALAQLVGAALGLPPLRGRAADLDKLSGAELGDRERELLELVLLDRAVVEPPRARALARLAYDALARKAGDGPLVVAIDDAHFLDRVSREVLAQVVKLAQGTARTWCFVASARWVKPESFLSDAARVDLRPLGLRAMNQFAEALKIAPRQRHGLLAAAQGNPLALQLLVRTTNGQEPPQQVHALGEGLLPWLLTGILRQADPRDADKAWLAATLGEGAMLEEPLVQAARLYLEKDLPRDLAVWLQDRLTREGPLPEALGHAFKDATVVEAARRAQRTERLGLFRLAALELETALPYATPAERGKNELEVANLRAKAGDIKGAVDSFQAAARAGGERRPTALLRFARTLLDLGEKERAADALDLAQGALEQRADAKTEGHTRSMGEWLVLRAKTTLQRGDLAGAAVALQRARDLADQVARSDARTSRGLQALVQEARAELALATGDREAARTNFRQARDAFRDLGQHGDALRCLIALGEVELQMRDLRRAADTFRAASRLAATAGLVREEILAEVGLGETEIALGELDDGGQRLRAAFRRVSAEEEEGTLGARAALGMAHAMAARRLFADVFRYTERARALSKNAAISARAGLVEAQAYVGQDQPRKAHKALSDAFEAARSASDALLVERVRQMRAELERAVPTEAVA